MSAHTTALVAALAALTLAACSEPEAQAPATPAPAAKAAEPALPEGPLTQAGAISLMNGLPLACKPIASMKFDMHQCDVKRGLVEGDQPLIDSLRSLRAELEALPESEVTARCTSLYRELGATPKPQACW
ncbi:MAG: hypothetical protein Q8R97_14060 [Brevundimonas sp.]|uniref:hypothetical protein n=1 Tax=Brevundimonas sp. TaxID=1871086 RepID=UPI0027640604|nr:hypothetical protein [Brevundimonas sp.]MDP3402231.1 hypothetical protein [Brevundimonas sp.]MDZ4111489.1 hypothetical protein [Brevundimonas sp.]